jgi:phage tail sheath protein FI
MSADTFLHGAETDVVPQPVAPVAPNNLGVLGAIITADGADTSVFPLNQPVLVDNQQILASLTTNIIALTGLAPSGQGPGTGPQALSDFFNEGGGVAVVVRVADSATLNTVLGNIVGEAATNTGAYALLNAQPLLGVKPRTLIAPGYTSQRIAVPSAGTAGPSAVVAALLIIAASLRGRVYAGMPSTEAEAETWALDFTAAKLTAFFPNLLTLGVGTGAYVVSDPCAANAGLLARTMQTLGFWYSASNQPFNSVGGVSVPIGWSLDDPSSLANILNSNNITTAINQGATLGAGYGGWRRWGNRNLDPTGTVFECVATTLDAVYEALQVVNAWAVDKPPSATLIQQLTYQANAFLGQLVTQGALLPGATFWIDPANNSVTQLEKGIWTWSLSATAPAPMEHIITLASQNPADYVNLLQTMTVTIQNTGSN